MSDEAAVTPLRAPSARWCGRMRQRRRLRFRFERGRGCGEGVTVAEGAVEGVELQAVVAATVTTTAVARAKTRAARWASRRTPRRVVACRGCAHTTLLRCSRARCCGRQLEPASAAVESPADSCAAVQRQCRRSRYRCCCARAVLRPLLLRRAASAGVVTPVAVTAALALPLLL